MPRYFPPGVGLALMIKPALIADLYESDDAALPRFGLTDGRKDLLGRRITHLHTLHIKTAGDPDVVAEPIPGYVKLAVVTS